VVATTIGGCERSRVQNRAGGEATRVVHARDRAEKVVGDEVRDRSWASSDAGQRADAAPELAKLTPLVDTPFELGAVDVIADSGGAAIERQEWSFEGIRGVSYRVRVPLDAPLAVIPSDEILPLNKLLPDEVDGDFVAINGGFYDVDNLAMGLVVSGSETTSKLAQNGGSGIVERRDGTVRVIHRRDFEPGADEALQSIDRIVAEGKSLLTEGRRERHTARSAIAVGEDYLWFVVAVESASIAGEPGAHSFQLQSTSYRGLPLWAFARYLIATTDVVDALNLDGAVSTQMIARLGGVEVDIRGEKGTINAVSVVLPRDDP
jgi:hypothetical protein